jgi:hypothetical protein
MQRAGDEPGFHELLQKCPAAVLGAYALTAAEKAALMSGDQAQLEAVGVAPAAARQWIALDGLA